MMTIEEILASPPPVHAVQNPEAPLGVWSTDLECYRYLATVAAGGRSLETGCGVSTAVLAQVTTHHTAVYLEASEGEILTSWAAVHNLDLAATVLLAGGSDAILPGLKIDPVDLVFIDGGHAFPLPIIDWYYASRHLKDGGHLVVDDIQLPHVQRLIEFLDHDPRWIKTRGGPKWDAFQRTGSGPLSESWVSQAWLPPIRSSDVIAINRLRNLGIMAGKVARSTGGRLRNR